jgi:hypothetical protein
LAAEGVTVLVFCVPGLESVGRRRGRGESERNVAIATIAGVLLAALIYIASARR